MTKKIEIPALLSSEQRHGLIASLDADKKLEQIRQEQRDIPAEKRTRWTRPQPVLGQDHWDEMHDALTLALDALGDGPASTDRDLCWRNLGVARAELKRAQSRAEKWAAREANKQFLKAKERPQ
ncbi:MAG: hypothetical protein AAGF50_00975 [Pseudomonadota bacterium]